MKVFRISKCIFINDLTGTGSYTYGGRWNSKGVRILYTSVSSSLALLESVAHGVKPNTEYCLAVLDIPEDKIFEINLEQLPAGWKSNLAPEVLKKIGDNFVREMKYLGIKVPSVLNQYEFNFLLNPRHPDFQKVKIISTVQVTVDGRLIGLN